MRLIDDQSGQLLLEILIVIGVAAIIIVLGSQLILTGLRSNKVTGEIDASVKVLEETSETVRSVTSEKWQNLFGLQHDGTQYYPQQSGTKWVFSAGSENVTIKSIAYNRYFIVQHVCRSGGASRDITGVTDSSGSTATCTTSGGTYDPSTEKITATVTWQGTNTQSSSEYITRWRNKVCNQTDWNTVGSGPETCPSNLYDSKTNVTPTTDIQLCFGGC